MKIITKIVCVFLLLQKSLYAQNAELTSLQHVVRWVSEANFPNYTTDPEVKDSIFNIAGRALKKRFKVQNVTMPAYIDYDYINGFGKANIHKPGFSSSVADFSVSILSSITRATVGFSVLWKMEIVVGQKGQTVFSKK
jgi:hypothetical protein